jgi:hypothetical protein
VKWEVVCKDKRKGGLGVRKLEVVNQSLLMKWRWRLLNSEDSSLSKEVLVAKYGMNIVNNVNVSFEFPLCILRLFGGKMSVILMGVWILPIG